MIYGNTEIPITEIQKYKLQKYNFQKFSNTNYRITSIMSESEYRVRFMCKYELWVNLNYG